MNLRFPPNDHRHYRGLDDEDDDGEVSEPDTKRARTFNLMLNSLKTAGVSDMDATNYCNAILGDASESTFVE